MNRGTAAVAAICALTLWTGAVQAQDDAPPAPIQGAPEPDSMVEAEGAGGEAANTPEAEAEDGEDKDPMGSFGVGLKVGLFGLKQKFGAAMVNNMGSTAVVAEETNLGFKLGIPLMIGDGHGFGVDLMPFFAKVEDFNYWGFSSAFGVRFQVADPAYMFIGLGPEFAGMTSDGYGGGIFGGFRLPVNFTYYLLNALAVMGEASIGYGGTASISSDGNGASAKGSSGLTFDITAGVRFP